MIKYTSLIEASVYYCIFNIDGLIHGPLSDLVFLTPPSVKTDHISSSHYLHEPLLAVHSQTSFHFIMLEFNMWCQ